MTKFDAKRVAALKENYASAAYMRRVWKTNDELTITLEEYGEYIDPSYKHVVKAEIIEKERKENKGTFLKIAIYLEGGSVAEWDLPYPESEDDELDLDEGDVLDLSTIKFCTQVCLEKTHKYAISEVAE